MFNNDKIIIEKLQSFEYFSDMDYDILKSILEYSNCVTYKANKAIYYQGDDADKIYLILDGEIKKIKYRYDTTSELLGLVENGKWLGLPEVLLGRKYLTDATTSKETLLLSFLKTNFNRILKHIDFNKIIIKELSKECYNLHNHIDAYTPYQKMIRYILARIKNFPEFDSQSGNHIIKMTQDRLAEISGTTRETINRYLSELQSKKLIKTSRGKIEIINLDEINKIL